MLPTRYWITTGKGESENSVLNAVDVAFMNAGLGYQNHVIVSSIPPGEEISPRIVSEKGLTYVPVKHEYKLLPFSSIVHVIRSMNTGSNGDEIACSIALAKGEIIIEEESSECILAFESNGSSIIEVEEKALDGVKNMVKIRKVKLHEKWGNSGFKIISSSLEIGAKHGCVVSFVVLDPFTYEEV